MTLKAVKPFDSSSVSSAANVGMPQRNVARCGLSVCLSIAKAVTSSEAETLGQQWRNLSLHWEFIKVLELYLRPHRVVA